MNRIAESSAAEDGGYAARNYVILLSGSSHHSFREGAYILNVTKAFFPAIPGVLHADPEDDG